MTYDGCGDVKLSLRGGWSLSGVTYIVASVRRGGTGEFPCSDDCCRELNGVRDENMSCLGKIAMLGKII